MVIYLCPGYHSADLTAAFVRGVWPRIPADLLVFPSDLQPPYSPDAVLHYLRQHYPASLDNPLVVTWIGFSAGVAGGILAARQGQREGYTVDKFIAIDGWGVPLGQRFPIYSMAHDRWAHDSQRWWDGLWSGHRDRPRPSFIADPAVEHLDLWRSPHQTPGYLLSSTGDRQPCTAADCLRTWTRETP